MSSFSEYYKYISLIVNPFSMVMSGIVWASVGFILSALLVIFLRKIILVKRRHVLLTILAYSYLFVTPLLTAYSGFKYGFVNRLRNETKAYIDKNAVATEQAFSLTFAGNIDSLYTAEIHTSSALSLTGKEAIDSLSSVIYGLYGKTLQIVSQQEGMKGKFADVLLSFSKKENISKIMKHSISRLLRDKLGNDSDLNKHVLETKLVELLKEGLFVRIIGAQVDGFLWKIQKSILMLFFLLLLVPVIEISLAHYLHKKQNTATGSANPAIIANPTQNTPM